jgi:hypothetical protein
MPPQFYTADQTAPAQNLCRYQWLKPGESCAEKMETVSTVFRSRSHKAVETAWSRIASTHRAEARC